MAAKRPGRGTRGEVGAGEERRAGPGVGAGNGGGGGVLGLGKWALGEVQSAEPQRTTESRKEPKNRMVGGNTVTCPG